MDEALGGRANEPGAVEGGPVLPKVPSVLAQLRLKGNTGLGGASLLSRCGRRIQCSESAAICFAESF